MQKLKIIITFNVVMMFFACQHADVKNAETKTVVPDEAVYALVIHGGAGTITRERMSAEMDSTYRATLNEVLQTGKDILMNGGSSMDAVESVISMMEDSPLFNAGKGAVFSHDGINEMDASVMNGGDLQAGAVGGLTTVKNPIKAARKVLENSEHVFLTGKGAEAFAKTQSVELVEPEYFYTERRWNSLQRALEKEKSIGSIIEPENADYKYGTVGAVALDMKGNIVAGTSTGGMTNKRYGRIGDSPIIGSGTYADNQTCGVSCTGHGEFFIRYAVAHDLSAMMAYGDYDLVEAADTLINTKLLSAGGSGGLIALDKHGNIAIPFNTEGMYRGYVTDKELFVAIYKDE